MADVTAHTIIKTRPRSGRDSLYITDTVTLYAGCLVGVQSGYANHWASGANDVFLGICLGGDDWQHDGILIGETTTGTPPSAPSTITEAFIDTSGVVLMGLTVNGTPSQAKVGDVVYCATSNTDDITLTSTGNHPIGWMCKYTSATDQEVQLFTPAEMLAQATA